MTQRPAKIATVDKKPCAEPRTADGPPPPEGRPFLEQKVEQAIRSQEGAQFLRARADGEAHRDPTGARFDRRDADALEVEAESLLGLPDPFKVIGNGAEMMPLPDNSNSSSLNDYIRETVDPKRANITTAVASQKRMELAAAAGVLPMAVDAVAAIVAPDSFSKAAAHQLMALHSATMRLAQRMHRHLDSSESLYTESRARRAYDDEAIRLLHAVARGVDSYSRAALALKAYLGGTKQEVRVTHVHQQVQVNEGGQAVVAGGDAKPGKRGPGGGRKPRGARSK